MKNRAHLAQVTSVRYPTSSAMRYGLPIVFLLAAIGCAYVQDFDVPNGPPSSDAGASEASCASLDDPANCGACGHSCLGGACAGGVCQPLTLAAGQGDSCGDSQLEEDGTVRPPPGPDRIVADEQFVYWYNLRGEIMRVPVDGGDVVRLAAKPSLLMGRLAIDDEFVYFGDARSRTVMRVPKQGGASMSVTPPIAGDTYAPVDFGLDSANVYWIEPGGIGQSGGVRACPKLGCSGTPDVVDQLAPWPDDGGGPSTYYEKLTLAARLPTEQTVLFVSGYEQGGPGGGDEGILIELGKGRTLISPLGATAIIGSLHFVDIAADDQYIYTATDPPGQIIIRSNYSGPGVDKVVASGEDVSPDRLVLDDRFVYWPDHTSRRVLRCGKDGCSHPEILAAETACVRDVAVTEHAIFWTVGDGRVMELAKPANTAMPTR